VWTAVFLEKAMASKVEIYTKPTCAYSIRAKHLLNSKGIEFTEYSIDGDEALAVMNTRSNGQHSVPQIFIQDQHIGGCNDLYALEQEGKLDQLLQNLA